MDFLCNEFSKLSEGLNNMSNMWQCLDWWFLGDPDYWGANRKSAFNQKDPRRTLAAQLVAKWHRMLEINSPL